MNRPGLVRAALLGGALASCLILLAGCGGGRPMPAAANPNLAKESLEKALSKWAAGEKPEALAAESPQIYVSDFDWKDGRKLKSFQIAGPAEEVGLQVRLPAMLEVEDAAGRIVRSDVSYTVSTSPVVSIVRDDVE